MKGNVHGADTNIGTKFPTAPKCSKIPGKGSVGATGKPPVKAGIGGKFPSGKGSKKY